ncbi:MAG: putative type II secretion system protein F [Syntrophorhabdus sp. PtaU1.Bin002]|nr:MAG: putative type II secretion system protein F [Syntrophorhabdus sp. PtaB.Bin006]OPY66496.1 MAG: putative type II secretion system protein F [Syntrophorhabdus sp. PtaU1.Bin002]
MAIFSYVATTMDGVMMEGVIEAANEDVAIDRLKTSGVIPIRVAAPKESLKKRITFKSSRGDLLAFTTELSVLLSAGLPLDRSLNVVAETSESRGMKEIVHSILRSIREGSSFSEALIKHPKMFTQLYINMVKAGEAGGVLAPILEKLNEFLESTKELKDNVVSAMIYPAILTLTGGLSIIVLLTFVLPKFSTIFSTIGGSLPLTTQILLAVSGAFKLYWWVGLLLTVWACVGFVRYIRSETGSYRWDVLKLKLMEDVVQKLETARFCRTLGTLLASGVSVLTALNNAKDVIGNRVIAAKVDAAAKGVKEGKGVAGPLGEAGVFPSLAISMMRVGEETGQLDTMLLKVAGAYEKSLRQAVKRFMSILEPAIILGMGLIIGFIVISILAAIFSMVDLPF